jgi:hypothetical protein
MKEEETGYRFKNNENIKVLILAYMDDLVIIYKSKKEMIQTLKGRKILYMFGMKIFEKSTYTNNEKIDNEELMV